MNVRSLKLRQFTRHAKTDLAFPERGVILVTGANGSGKSSVLEGVAYALFGETLRGSSPWGEGGGEVEACTDQVSAHRTRKGDKTALTWHHQGELSTAYPTTTKAQEALESIIGSFETWRRTHVFSSADAAHFTLATDKERKLFLESMLGLGRFDEALERCRLALRAAERAEVAAQSTLSMCRAQQDGQTMRMQDAQRVLSEMGPPSPSANPPSEAQADLEERRRHLREHVKKAEREVVSLHAEIARASGDTGGAERELAMLARRLQKLGESGICDSCGQAVPEELRLGLKRGIEKVKRGVQEQQERAGEASADFRAEAKDIEVALQKLRAKEGALSSELDGLKRDSAARANAERTRASAERQVADVTRALAEVQALAVAAGEKVLVAEHELKVCQAAEQVLGLRGVRAGILSRLLGGLEAAANAWVGRLAGAGLRLELRPYSEKKSGGVSDSIGLRVLDAGGEARPYASFSGGERRRLDIALLLAFAGAGSLFLDECLDSLDSDGIEAVCGVLGELAKDRAVVLVTHSEELAGRVPHTARWRVVDGKVSVG